MAALVGLLVGLEGVLRATRPIYRSQLIDDEYTGSFPVEMNPRAYRGSLLTEDKRAGELRVLGLGDSVTFGTGVATKSTWPYQLEAVLKEQRKSRTVVALNLGVEGWSLEDILRDFREEWAQYRPDVVVLALTGSMVALEAARPGETYLTAHRYASLHNKLSWKQELTRSLNRILHSFCLPSFLSLESQRILYWDGLLRHDVDLKWPIGPMLAHGFRQGNLDPAVAEKAWSRFGTVLKEVSDEVAASGAALLVTYVPPRFLVSDDVWDNEKNVPVERFSIDPLARVEQMAGELHIPYVNALTAIRRERPRIAREASREADMYIFFDTQHLSEDGHRALAKAIAAEMPWPARTEAAAVSERHSSAPVP